MTICLSDMDVNHKDFEAYSLINYIGTLPDGHILKDIAIRRLSDLQNKQLSQYEFRDLYCNMHKAYKNRIPVINIENGKSYPSIKEAAAIADVNEHILSQDIRRKSYKYPFRKVEDYNKSLL